MGTKTRFEEEAKGNSEMAYSTLLFTCYNYNGAIKILLQPIILFTLQQSRQETNFRLN